MLFEVRPQESHSRLGIITWMANEIKSFSVDEITEAPLVVDAIYEALGGSMAYEPLSRMFKCANQGGFRAVKSKTGGFKYIVLYSSLGDADWPDTVDIYNGIVTYYGDNKRPGHDIHETPVGGNRILRDYFEALHSGDRKKIAPIFFFTKGTKARDAVFRGLLVPGAAHVRENEDLVAIWKSKNDQRFQNYRATFTILDTGSISRSWIDNLISERDVLSYAPNAWIKWKNSSLQPKPLKAERVVLHRTKKEQLPNTQKSEALLYQIYDHFKDDPFAFEKCAAELVKTMDTNIVSYEVTQKSRDGGIDAHAEYRIGLSSNSIRVSCAIEAKCYAPGAPVGVRGTSRLISRLRYRQFGVLVTTSYVDQQAYKEIVEDEHPLIIISGRDIISILDATGVNTPSLVNKWLLDITQQ